MDRYRELRKEFTTLYQAISDQVAVDRPYKELFLFAYRKEGASDKLRNLFAGLLAEGDRQSKKDIASIVTVSLIAKEICHSATFWRESLHTIQVRNFSFYKELQERKKQELDPELGEMEYTKLFCAIFLTVALDEAASSKEILQLLNAPSGQGVVRPSPGTKQSGCLGVVAIFALASILGLIRMVAQ